MKLHQSNNIVLKTLSAVNYYKLLATSSKYNTDMSDMSENIIKQSICSLILHSVDTDF